jgi:hypothetical protein
VLDKIDRQFFIENKGQWPKEVLYLSSIGGRNTWITNFGVVYDFYNVDGQVNPQEIKHRIGRDNALADSKVTTTGQVVKMTLESPNQNLNATGNKKKEAYYNYLLGNDESKWATNVGLFKEALVKNVFNHIDQKYYFDNDLLRYDFVVNKGGSVKDIKMRFEGCENLRIQDEELLFNTRFGVIKQSRPFAYQEINGIKNPIDCKFKINTGGVISFELGEYNPNIDLVIDPLVYSTYIGGGYNDYAVSMKIDANNFVYLTGGTSGPAYPVTAGAYNTIWNLGVGPGTTYMRDAFVTKLNQTGTALVFSTFIGGTGDDIGSGIYLDAGNNVYISGATNSSGGSTTKYPTTTGAFQTNNAGLADAFVTKLNPTGTGLVYSTYLGGAENDYGTSIAVNQSTNIAFITGYSSMNGTIGTFPTTTGCYNPTSNGGGDDIFITNLNSTGTACIYSTYIGGSGYDEAYALTIDANDNAYITGVSTSTNYPSTTTFGGGSEDAFLTKINATGTALVYSNLFGGTQEEFANAIGLNASGQVYIAGCTNSANLPHNYGAYQPSPNVVLGWDVFVTQFNTSGSWINSNIIGASVGDDQAFGMVINSAGNVYLTGWTGSSNYPTTSNAFDQTINVGFSSANTFITRLPSDLSSIGYSTFIGGTTLEKGWSIAVDAYESIYMTGYSWSSNYPIYPNPGAYQTTNGFGFGDVIVTKLCIQPAFTPSINSNSPICEGGTLNLSTTYSGTGVTYNWSGPNGFHSTLQNPSILNVSGLNSGVYTIIVTDAGGCTGTNTIIVYVSSDPCNNPVSIQLTASTLGTSSNSNINGYKLTSTILTITGNVSFINTVISVVPNASIVVSSGSILTLKSTRIHGCSGMWRGISVEPGGQLILSGSGAASSSLIEDANIAVSVANHTSTNNILDITNTIFNKCLIGIQIANYNTNTTTYPFIIKNNVFTSRSLPFPCVSYPNWPSVNTLQLQNAPTNNLNSPFYMQNYSAVGLLNGSAQPSKHINLQSVGYSTGTQVSPNFMELLVGGVSAGELNLFDRSDYGIYLSNTNALITNSIFQNCKNSNNGGVAIYASRNLQTLPAIPLRDFRLRVQSPSGNNTNQNVRFFSNNSCIVSVGYLWNEILYNDMRSLQSGVSPFLVVPATGGNSINNNTEGQLGISTFSTLINTNNINNNTIYNIYAGIINRGAVYSSGTNSYLGYTNISNNYIADKPTSNTSTSSFISDAIVSDVGVGVTSSTYTNLFINPYLNISNNVITNAFRGISVSNYKWSKHRIREKENIITLMRDPNQNVGHTQHGISNTYSYNTYSANNKVTGFNINNNQLLNESNYYGAQNFGYQIWTCNNSINGYYGYQFAQVQPTTQWNNKNIMNGIHYYGYFLNSGAVIGAQMFGTNSGIDNEWNGNFIRQTYTFNSQAQLSPIYVRSNAPYQPTNNNASPPLWTYQTILPTSIIIVPNASADCRPEPQTVAFAPINIGTLDAIASDSIANGMIDSAEILYISKWNLYNQQLADSAYISASSGLHTFFTSSNDTSHHFRKMADIEKKLFEGNWPCAATLISAFSPANAIEINHKLFYELYLKWNYTPGSWEEEDSEALSDLAMKCPHYEGAVIYNARSFYNLVYQNQYTFFGDACDPVGSYKSGHEVNSESKFTNFDVSIYPNPNGGYLNLECGHCDDNTEVIIYDAVGKIVWRKAIKYASGETLIQFKLASGIYNVSITNQTTQQHETKKLIVE